MEYETKKLTDAWEEKWVSDEELAGIETSLWKIRQTWENCRDLLAEEGRTLYHEISQDRIDLLMQQMQEVSDYAQGMADHFFNYQDEPFYKAFVNGATEYLSRINLAEYKTRDIMTYEYVEGGLEINSDLGLGFSDFLGEWAVAEVESGMSGADIAGITAAGAHMMLGHEQTAAVLLRGSDADQGMVRFAMYFEEQYRALEEAGVFEASDIVELTDYLDALAVQGEFEHSMDKPMLEFLNGMLDMLILPPLIEAMTGEELLTGEDLSGGQRIMKAVGAAMDIASIGQASLANGILKTGGRQALGILGKAATVEIGSNLAAYGTVSLGEALDLPVAVTIALGIGVGGGTHVKLSKVMFSDVDSAAVRAVSMADADEEVTALRYTDEAAEAGRGVSRVSGSESEVPRVEVEGGTSTSRPTWRQSELDAATDFPDYDAQKSFINGEEVPYGTKGSVRPDYYKDGFSVDIKNYNVESASGRSNLARNIEKQYYQRIENLPDGTKQSVMIDVRGQNISDAILDALYDDIMQRTNNGVEILFKMD